MPLALTSTVVFLTGTFLNSAQTVIYATVSIRSASDSRAGAVGWTSGMGRCGAVFGPWPGVRLLSAGKGDRSFTAFAPAGVSSMVFIGLAAVGGSRRTAEDNTAGRGWTHTGKTPMSVSTPMPWSGVPADWRIVCGICPGVEIPEGVRVRE